MANVALVISSLRAGGAERVLSELAERFASMGHSVTLVTLESAANDFYRLPPNVSRIGLDLLRPSPSLARKLQNNYLRIASLRNVLQIHAVDVVISFVDIMNVTTLLATIGMRLPVIVSERSNPNVHRVGILWGVLRAAVYWRAHALVVPSGAHIEWASRFIARSRIHIIPNAVRFEWREAENCLDGEGQRILAVGRLSHEKGFDLLIRAFAIARKTGANCSLTILGEGPEREALVALSGELGVGAAVEMPGAVEDVEGFYRKANVFVLSSRYEGFPNALLEAMSLGIPSISFACTSGPEELINHGRNGLLVPPENIEVLASTLVKLMEDPRARQDLGQGALDVRDRFSSGRVLGLWDELLRSSLESSSPTEPGRRS